MGLKPHVLFSLTCRSSGMYIRAADVAYNPQLRWVLQILLRTHGFCWRSRYGVIPCEHIYRVDIRGNQITVYHTAESGMYRTIATWTRMMVPLDAESGNIHVHMCPDDWPPCPEE